MKQQVLFIILNDYSAWEAAYLATNMMGGVMPGSPIKYEVKTVAPTLDAVVSLGGFRTIPDYSFENMPEDYAAIVLVGGMKLNAPEANPIENIVRKAISQHRIVGAICNGASFLASRGFLNNIKHTGNGLEQLKLWGGKNYTNETGFVERQAVRDGNIVTANGTATLEFTREMSLALEADTKEHIEQAYAYWKNGFYKE